MTKAKSKAAKLRARRTGRPRKEAPVFNADGKYDQSIAARKEAAQGRETPTEARQTVVDARQRQYGVSLKDALGQFAGYSLGRIYLCGWLGPVQWYTDEKGRKKHKKAGLAYERLSAGNSYATDMARYYALTGMPPLNARTMVMERVSGRSGIANTDNEAIERAMDRRDALRKRLMGDNMEFRNRHQTVWNVCVLDPGDAHNWPEHMIRYLIDGLDQLRIFYGMTVDQPKNVRPIATLA